MKKNLVKLAAVAAVVFAQVAGAQSFTGRMKADVPFTFQAGKATLAAGRYEVTMTNSSSGGSTFVRLGNLGNGSAIHFVVSGPHRKDISDGNASLRFSCLGDSCLLLSVNVLNKEYGTGMRHKITATERERLYTIALTPTKGKSAE